MAQEVTTVVGETSGSGSTDHRLVTMEYSMDEGSIIRRASSGRFTATSKMPVSQEVLGDGISDDGNLGGLWNTIQLDGMRPRISRDPSRPRVTVVDLFCGCGGLSLGIKRAAEAVGTRPAFLLAVDVDTAALSVYTQNLRPLRRVRQNFETLIDYTTPTDGMDQGLESLYLSHVMKSVAGAVDMVIAGPPCEGNSNFNNVTRRSDYRNRLYIDAVAAAIALDAKVVVIENVPMVKRSFQDVVNRSLWLLDEAGYCVHENEFDLMASEFGTPQDRRRHFLIAGKTGGSLTMSDFDPLKLPTPTVGEILGALQAIERSTTFDQPSRISDDNIRRINFLFDHDEYNLPDEERPDCHRLKDHSYPSIYGRMHPHLPASTITTGFLSPGRGRYTHPTEPRSLTPHEGARLQGFGEDFDWLEESGAITRNDYARMIGAAVPPQLAFAVGMCALSLL